jgi:hypothetical protein
MPVTKTTRMGKGRGYGGPAAGEGNKGTHGVGRPQTDVAAVIRAGKAKRLELLKEHLATLAVTAERESDQITATLGYLKHEDDKATRVELGGGLEIVRRIVDPATD